MPRSISSVEREYQQILQRAEVEYQMERLGISTRRSMYHINNENYMDYWYRTYTAQTPGVSVTTNPCYESAPGVPRKKRNLLKKFKDKKNV